MPQRRRRDWTRVLPPSRAPVHFAAFSESCPRPLCGLPFQPRPTFCHISPFPVIWRTGKGHHGGTLGPLTSCVARAESLHLSEPLEASGTPSSLTRQFPTLGWGPPAPKLETCPLTLQALPLDAPLRGWRDPGAPPSHKQGGASQIQVKLVQSPSPSHPTECSGRRQAVRRGIVGASLARVESQLPSSGLTP